MISNGWIQNLYYVKLMLASLCRISDNRIFWNETASIFSGTACQLILYDVFGDNDSVGGLKWFGRPSNVKDTWVATISTKLKTGCFSTTTQINSIRLNWISLGINRGLECVIQFLEFRPFIKIVKLRLCFIYLTKAS